MPLRWFIYNLKFLCIRIIGLIIRITPFKVYLVETLGLLLGLTHLCLNFRKWKKIVGFAKHTGSTLPAWLYLLKYFTERGRNTVWQEVIYEAPTALKKYITVENAEILKQAVREGKGTILVGAHYGPRLCMFMLHEIDIEARGLATHNALTPRIKSLIFKRDLWLKGRIIKANRSEKEFVRHLRGSGVVLIKNDLPRREGLVTQFLGFPARLSRFPFKLALRYDAPVFFYFFDKTQNGGYRLYFVPPGDFSTPEEGVKQYASFFQRQITKNPFLWDSVPHFLDCVHVDEQGPVHGVAGATNTSLEVDDVSSFSESGSKSATAPFAGMAKLDPAKPVKMP